MSGQVVAAGQVWRDNDWRCQVRELTVLQVLPDAAPPVAVVLRGGVRRRIRLERLRAGGSRGYTLVQDVATVPDSADKDGAQVPNPLRHNHVTRDIKAAGVCPACDHYLDGVGSR